MLSSWILFSYFVLYLTIFKQSNSHILVQPDKSQLSKIVACGQLGFNYISSIAESPWGFSTGLKFDGLIPCIISFSLIRLVSSRLILSIGPDCYERSYLWFFVTTDLINKFTVSNNKSLRSLRLWRLLGLISKRPLV